MHAEIDLSGFVMLTQIC